MSNKVQLPDDVVIFGRSLAERLSEARNLTELRHDGSNGAKAHFYADLDQLEAARLAAGRFARVVASFQRRLKST